MQLDIRSQLGEVDETLSDIYKYLDGGLEPMLQAIGSIAEGSIRERFSTKIAPDGTRWANLKPSTLKAKNGRGGILVDHGDLMKSITYHATENNVEVGSDRLYAKYLQTGTKNSDGTLRMAARPYLGLSEDDYADIGELVNDFLEDLTSG